MCICLFPTFTYHELEVLIGRLIIGHFAKLQKSKFKLHEDELC